MRLAWRAVFVVATWATLIALAFLAAGAIRLLTMAPLP